ncbi:MAG: SdrD B-like domain-containing protein [Verrucomicrobiota bacterium JB023]|nr:SdrD B-like domain-containing protein [Verrucomicrobiota bacterium JB023]
MKTSSPPPVISFVALSAALGSLQAQTVVEVGPNSPGTIVPVRSVTYWDDDGSNPGGDYTVVQTASQPTTVNNQRSTPVEIRNIELSNGVDLDIFNFEGVDVILQNFAIQSPPPQGIGVLLSDGTRVALSDGAAAYEASLEAMLLDSNINSYSYYDGISPDPTPGTPDFDLMLRFAYLPDEDYIFIQERDGNTFFELTALDIDGNPIEGANILKFGESGGKSFTVYDWNSGYANSSYQSRQEMAFSVAPASLFFEGTDVTPEPIFGFRIDNDGEADVKVMGASGDTFNNNPYNPNVPGGAPIPGSLSGQVLEDLDGDGIGDRAIAGVVLTLKDANGADVDSDPDTAGIQPTTTTTDGSGNYSFTGLEPVTYQVVQSQPEYFASVSDTDGANDNLIGSESPIQVTSNADNGGNDFVEESSVGAISGTVEADLNGDGSGDEALQGVLVTLKNSSGGDIDSDPATAGVQPTVTTTDANGNYSFVNLEPGNYRVVESDPQGYLSVSDVDGGNDNVIGQEGPIAVVAGQTNTGNDFLDEEWALIAGTVRSDGNASGTLQADNSVDPPIELVTVRLFTDPNGDGNPDDGVEVAQVETDGSGDYQFSQLPSGDYVVVQDQPDGYLSILDEDFSAPADDVADAGTDNIIPVTVTAGESDTRNDFLEQVPGAITGRVLADTDNDDEGEEGIGGVILTLKNAAGEDIDSDPASEGVQPTTTTTASDGSYQFTNLLPGSYQVVETDPADYLSVSDVDGGAVNTIGDEQAIVVLAGQSSGGNDFIDEQSATISGSVFADLDNDDSGDVGIAGVVLTLTDAVGEPVDGDPDAVGIQPITAVTDGDGYYEFSSVPPGDYGVSESQPSGYATVLDGDTTDAGDDALNGSVLDNLIPVSVNAGETDTGNDFVEEQPGSITGTVRADLDHDAVGDEPLAGVTVTLKNAAGEDIDSDPVTKGVQPTTAVTDSEGRYEFTNLLPGDYLVVESDLAGYESVGDVDGANDNTIGEENALTVVAGQSNDDNDFVDEQLASISGFVMEDTTGDGNGNLALASVEMVLFTDPNGDGDPADGEAIQTVSTGQDGFYQFNLVPVGDYVLVESQPSGFLTVRDYDGSSPADDAGNLDANDDRLPVSVVAGEEDTENNFVEAKPSRISGTVLADTDDDGQGEEPLENVILTLLSDTGEPIDADDNPDNGVQLVTTTTDQNGDYVFENLLFGDYQISQTQPAGYGSVSDGDTTQPEDDASNDDTLDDIIPVSVIPSEEDSGNDFIEVGLGSISGYVLEDTDNDAAGDRPLPGVVLSLTDGDGALLDADPELEGIQPITTTTDVNGYYVFSGLLPGDYGVQESQPPGYLSVLDGDFTAPDDDAANADSLDDFIPVSLAPDEVDTRNDFIEVDEKAGTFAEFQDDFALELGSDDGPADNPDGDMYPNALEYAFCLEPGSGLPGKGEFCLVKSDDGSVTAQFYRRRGGLNDVTYILEGADELGTPTTWQELASIVPTVDTSDADLPLEAEKVVYSDIQNASELTRGASGGVVRMKVEVDVDGNGSIASDEVFYSPAFGWQCVDYIDYQCATFCMPFSAKPVFSGTFAASGALTLATDGDGNVTLDVSNSPLAADLAGVVGSQGECYLQMTSGSLEGERFDILSGGLDQITLVNDPDIFSESDGVESLSTLSGVPADALFNGASFQVIRYQTVDDVFDKTASYAGLESTSPSTATRVLFYNSRKDNPGFEVLFLFGSNAENSKWVENNDLVFLNDAGGYRLDPAGGNWIHPKISGDSLEPSAIPQRQFVSGMIANHHQAVALNEGFNLVGAMWPYEQSAAGPSGRNYSVLAGFDGGVDPDQSSEILYWLGDQAADTEGASYRETYDAYMLLDGGGMQNWVDTSDPWLNDLDASLTFPSYRAAFLKLLADDEKESHLYPFPNFGLEN